MDGGNLAPPLWPLRITAQEPCGLGLTQPQKYVKGGPKPKITAVKAIILHTFGRVTAATL